MRGAEVMLEAFAGGDAVALAVVLTAQEGSALDRETRNAGREPAVSPFPNVANHVVGTGQPGLIASDRGGSGKAVAA